MKLGTGEAVDRLSERLLEHSLAMQAVCSRGHRSELLEVASRIMAGVGLSLTPENAVKLAEELIVAVDEKDAERQHDE